MTSQVWTCILAPCSLYFIWVRPPKRVALLGFLFELTAEVFPHLWREGCYALPLATLAVPLPQQLLKDRTWTTSD